MVDGSSSLIEAMLKNASDKEVMWVDTERCDEINEIQNLTETIEFFLKSRYNVLLAKYSGRESVALQIGDETPEMVLCLSHNPESKHYTEDIINVFTRLINMCEKETI